MKRTFDFIPRDKTTNGTDFAEKLVIDLAPLFSVYEILEHNCDNKNYCNSELLTEALVQPKTPLTNACNTLVDELLKIKLDTELIIIDPYFLASSKDDSWMNIFRNLNGLKNIILITDDRNIDSTVKSNLEKLLVSLKIIITTVLSRSFHDRFWITNKRTEALFVGTSLNSIGSKYSLIAKMDNNDTNDLVEELKKII